METEAYTLIKKRAEIFMKGLHENSTNFFKGNAWELRQSDGEYDSTHVIVSTDSKIPFNFRDRYFVSESKCLKASVDEFSLKINIEDCSSEWEKCD